MTDHMILVLESLRPEDTLRTSEIFPPERRVAILAAAMDSPQRTPLDGSPARPVPGKPSARVARSPVRLIVLAVAALIAVVVLASGLPGGGARLGPAPATGAVVFRARESGVIVALVKEPYAAQSRLDAAFAGHGFDIQVSLLPVSPSLVGTLIYVSEEGEAIRPLGHGPCLTGGGGCAVGVTIAADFSGKGYITLGRPARPGEGYESQASAFAPGEPLHCSGLLGAHVSDAVGVLSAHRLTATWREDESQGRSSKSQTLSAPPMANYIWEATLSAAGAITVWTEPTRWPADGAHGAQANVGCKT
jgi:hypothetical protein